MRKYFVTVTALILVMVLSTGCAGAPSPALMPTPKFTPTPTHTPIPTTEPFTPTPVPTIDEGNLRLLISDEVNAIEDFEQLHVTISSIGVHEAVGGGKWHEFELDPNVDLDADGIDGVDLRPLEGENALEIWSGDLEDGEYNKVFIYVESVTGVLVGGGATNVKVPSGKLQISKPFTIGDSVVNFVYDITVIKAGKNGKYNLKPQIAQSGPDKNFNDVTPQGRLVDTGKPEGEEAEELEFVGTIVTISDNWTMTIDNETWMVDVSEAEIEGDAVEGREAKVKGTVVDDNIIIATEVEIVETEDNIAPVINVSGVTNDQQYTGSVTPIIEISDDIDEEPTVVATLNGNSFTSGTVIDEVGIYELEIIAKDASGNEAEVTITFEIVAAE